jgi:hypothetical protein
VYWRLRGEDMGVDDHIYSPTGGGQVGPDGTFFFTKNALGTNLNEDFGGQDEVYAEVYYNLGGPYHKSNTIKRYF